MKQAPTPRSIGGHQRPIRMARPPVQWIRDGAGGRRGQCPSKAAIAGFLVGLMTFAIQAVGAIVDIKRVDLDKALIVEAVASILIGFFVSIVVRSGVRSAFPAASTAQLSARNRIVAPGIRSDTDGTLGIRREPSYRDRLRSYDVNVDVKPSARSLKTRRTTSKSLPASTT
jgi:hypothetical protein